ncbi:hypothetical protein ACPV3U_01780 [Vibrio rotiferianus]|uniref:hypothetical protein n=1 Tax=Vibrio rotiferianus TaxID=190895 RepID=UPI00406A4AFE
MKKLVLFTSCLFSLSLEAKVDMADPTAVYSSFGAEVNSEDGDMSIGIASGRHLALLESKGGFDKLKLTYANMTDGQGFYTEIGGNKDIRNVSAGYIMTFKFDALVIYPVAMLGYTNNEVIDDYDMTSTVGWYTRYKFGDNFHLGLDPFYSSQYGTEYLDSLSTDLFIGYQRGRHRFRVGVNMISNDEEQYFANYKVAF